ncbi:Histidine biosynthesis trifunctional protein [Zancudomyces culisetae]|uniref:Histidine biosynthesis trifunctional protein n=1 Tax=Zancudomyces culisetae TaxID=1213189 RepID=A0A1R1PT93_ZANCU|nr:Histidine biosynthesis trifunctional protein [Zancudomyces culisetae]|eukprot:OMH84123.1 Histidine biosynthesis trifunctional protein [Zancudomyces culisetae]
MLIPIIKSKDTTISETLSILPYRIYEDKTGMEVKEYEEGSWVMLKETSTVAELIEVLNKGAELALINGGSFGSLLEELKESKVPAGRIGLYVETLQEYEELRADGMTGEDVIGAVYVNNLAIAEVQSDRLKTLSAAFTKAKVCQGGQRKFVVRLNHELLTNNGTKAIDVLKAVAESEVEIGLEIQNIKIDEIEDYVEDAGKVRLSDAFIIASKLNTDRQDGLYTTVVEDDTGRCLGVGYSSKDSISEAIRTLEGVYYSRKRGLWYKGKTSGSTQKLRQISVDCDADLLRFVVEQRGSGFCHNDTWICFDWFTGDHRGMLGKLSRILEERRANAPEGSYTQRLFNDNALLHDKIMEEAAELCEATQGNDIAWEAADLIYFALVKCASQGVKLSQIEKNLFMKSKKLTRRPGNSKHKMDDTTRSSGAKEHKKAKIEVDSKAELRTWLGHVQLPEDPNVYKMRRFDSEQLTSLEVAELVNRPLIDVSAIKERVKPIIEAVQQRGDKAILELTEKFDGVKTETVVLKAPFDVPELSPSVKEAIDAAYTNIKTFHQAQMSNPMVVETLPGVVCSRFSRAIERVGLYVPGGSAILPSSALMLGVPAQVAGCNQIVIATPPNKQGKIADEVLYVASLVEASAIVMAGGAQAVAALAYGTETVPKVDKIFGPGNQYVTAAKMLVQSDNDAMVAIDMPAGPSEVLVIADSSSNAKFVASDLLSQAEHGTDSQSVLLTVGLSDQQIFEIEEQVQQQSLKLTRRDIVRHSISKSYILQFSSMDRAIEFSNRYAPEHLILQIEDPESVMDSVVNAGSVFMGHYSPESCGDYASGTNHTLPTYGYSKMYSGVNTHSFLKFITSQHLTKEGLANLSSSVITLAEVEGLDAHKNAVVVRLEDCHN